MIETYWYAWVVCFSAVWGVIAGRVFAVEGQHPLGAILAAGYCGGGTGLLSGPPFALLLTQFAKWSSAANITDGLLGALDDFGAGLLWGAIGGTGGGLAAGVVVVLLGGGRRASLK